MFRLSALNKKAKELIPKSFEALNRLFELLNIPCGKAVIMIAGMRAFAATSLQNISTGCNLSLCLISGSISLEIPEAAIQI